MIKYIEEYQKRALATAVYKDNAYPYLGLCGEAGEVADKYKKILRDKDGVMSGDDAEAIAYELGDVAWYINAIARDIGYTLPGILSMNIHKLESRKERGVIGGNGDNR